MINRKDLARRVSDKTGYYMQDIIDILEAEEDSIAEFIEEGHTKIKHHKLFQLEVKVRPSKKAYDGFSKEYFELPERKYIDFKPLRQMEDAINKINGEGK